MNEFKIGDIVTLKSHPLFSPSYNKIKDHFYLVPPLMLIKEVYFENESKKKLFSDKIENAKITDLVKYKCVFFNMNKSEFSEVMVYQSLIKTYLDLNYHRKDEKRGENGKLNLIEEVLKYEKVSKYQYGMVVQLKTKKLEQRKSFDISKGINPFQTPDFVVNGIVRNESENEKYNNGKDKALFCDKLLKITWYNYNQAKLSETLLPIEFFVKDLFIHNKTSSAKIKSD